MRRARPQRSQSGGVCAGRGCQRRPPLACPASWARRPGGPGAARRCRAQGCCAEPLGDSCRCGPGDGLQGLGMVRPRGLRLRPLP
eukprot:440411-Pyramimonas_sp.AAC.1